MGSQWVGRLVKGVGAGLCLMSILPASRLLDGSKGFAVGDFVSAASSYSQSGFLALAVVLLVGLALWPWATRVLGGLRRFDALSDSRLAFGAGLLGLFASAAFSLVALDGGPLLVDGMSQLVQARLFAAGALAIPSDAPIEFVYYQYLAPSDLGWASQYPPGFSAILAVGMLIGAPWLVGPVVHGATAWLGVRFAGTLFPDDRPVVLVTAGLLALSPFSLALAGAYMNHGVAAFLGLVAVYGALRAEPSGKAAYWGIAAGFSVGLLATVRPLTAVCVAVSAGLAWALTSGAATPSGVLRRMRFPIFAAVAALPPTLALLWFNAKLFGGALSWGYTAAQGPNHGLGFHVDPWGAMYGLSEAFAYSATELRALGAEMAGVPLPLVAWLGVAILFSGARARLLIVPVVWATSLVVAGFFYWHHDLSMGPRLLADTAPAWYVLVAWAVVASVRWAETVKRGAYGGYVRSVSLACLAAALVATPIRLAIYGIEARGRGLMVESIAAPNSVVFVHDSWDSRLAGRLAAMGFRDDEIRMARAAWSSCDLYNRISLLDASPEPSIERLLAGSGQRPLSARTMPSGSVVRTYEGEALSAECQREAGSDFRGISGLPQRSWRGDLPGAERGRAMYVRDMGPERNLRLLRVFPEREVRALIAGEGASPSSLVSYEEGMEVWWGGPGGPP